MSHAVLQLGILSHVLELDPRTGTRSLPTCKDLVPSINEPTATLDNDEYNAEKGEPRSLLFDAVTHLGAEGPASHTRTVALDSH